MTPVLAPPIFQPRTASSAVVMVVPPYVPDDLVEEPMDYRPIAPGRLAAPQFPDEAWADDGSGPMGF